MEIHMTEIISRDNPTERFYDLSDAYALGLEQFEEGDFASAEITFEKSELSAIETCAGSIMHARILIAWSICTKVATRYTSQTPRDRQNTALIIQERLRVGIEILESVRTAVGGKAGRDIEDEIREAHMLFGSITTEIEEFRNPKPPRPHIFYN